MQISDKKIAQYVKECGDTLRFKLAVSGLEGIIIPNDRCFTIVIQNNADAGTNRYTVNEFLTSDYKNLNSFYRGYDGFSDFKIVDGIEGYKFRNFDGKNEVTLDELTRDIWLNNIKRNDIGWIAVSDIFPFNRIEVDEVGIHLRKKAIIIKNRVEYLIYDPFDNSFGFYTGTGDFICSFMDFIKPTADKFIYVNLGMHTIFFYEKAFIVESSNKVLTDAPGYSLQYTDEGFFTIVDLLKNFKELLECQRKFVSICRQSKALIKG
jgi:hypothetical protein